MISVVMTPPGRRGRRWGRLLVPVLLVVVPCSGFFWQPLRCLNVSWAARGPACSGNFSARTCARSQAEIDAYRATLEAELNGPSAAPHTHTVSRTISVLAPGTVPQQLCRPASCRCSAVLRPATARPHPASLAPSFRR